MTLELPNDMTFKTVPYEHQVRGLMLQRDEEYFAILCEMGTGKSALLLYTAQWLFSQGKINGLVIIAPKSALRSWSDIQVPVHLPDNIDRRAVAWGGNTKALEAQLKTLLQVEPLKLHILIMNPDACVTDRGYDALEKFLLGHQVLMAVDESTSIKSPSASRTKVLTKLGRRARYRRILTGTPVANRPLDIWSQFEFLSAGCLGSSSWFTFRNRYAVTETRHINGRKFVAIVGFQRLEELQKLVADRSFRVLKKDCLDLPEKVYEKRYVELDPAQLKYYNELRDDALTFLASGTLVAAPLVITRVLRLRQALCNLAPAPGLGGEVEYISGKDPRLAAVLELVEEAGDQKILIWSCFVPSILKITAAVNELLGEGSAAPFYGATSAKQRQERIDDFQDPASKLRVLVLNQATGGEAITLTQASLCIYNDNDWSLKARQQSEDRAHRIGQKNTVTYIDIIAAKTVDELIVDALQDKRTLADAVTGDRLRELLTGGPLDDVPR